MAPWLQLSDDIGLKVELAHRPERVISLVPSWTQTLFALGAGGTVVAATRFCVEPAEELAAVPRIGGTKNPNLREILDLKPDLVIANAEENRREDIERLRDEGVPVLTTYPRTVPGAVESILRMGRALGREAEAAALARDITLTVSGIEAGLGVWSKLRLRVFCPIWKKPWMTFNADTYAHDVLRMMGFNNVYAADGERYPRTTVEQAIEHRPDVVLLPDEPYAFDRDDIEELKALMPAALARRTILVSGRDLHWYGVHMVAGLRNLNDRLSRLRAAVV